MLTSSVVPSRSSTAGRQLATSRLTDAGFDLVGHATDVADTTKMVTDLRPDATIVDITNGLQTAAALPDHGPRRRVTLRRLEGAHPVVVVQFEGIPGATIRYPPSMPLLIEEPD